MKLLLLILTIFLSSCIQTPGETTELLYIGTVNSENMSLKIYTIYLQEQIDFFEYIGSGAAIWQTNIFGQPTESLAMEHAFENMALSLIIRDIAKTNGIEVSIENVTENATSMYEQIDWAVYNADLPNLSYFEFFFESIAIREEVMRHLTLAYNEAQREEVFRSMEEAWLSEANIVRNLEEWNKLGVRR
ncbi:MAG: hypothetical protein FWF50_07910 [Defluviitaleaceae bacterium]|nr:hypothetical protein [Defluviitaleaceae bacterium]